MGGKRRGSGRMRDHVRVAFLPVPPLSIQTDRPRIPDDAFFAHLSSLPPSALDLELRSLSSPRHLRALVRAITRRLRARRDFDLVLAVLAVFLRVHGEAVVALGAEEEREEGVEGMRAAVERLVRELEVERERVVGLVDSGLGTLSFVSNAPVV